MSNQHNIDKLLKESFENFAPDAPNVWEAVQQGVQAAQAASAVSATTAVVAKTTIGLTVKTIAAIAIVAGAAITSVVMLTNSNVTNNNEKAFPKGIETTKQPEADSNKTETALPIIAPDQESTVSHKKEFKQANNHTPPLLKPTKGESRADIGTPPVATHPLTLTETEAVPKEHAAEVIKNNTQQAQPKELKNIPPVQQNNNSAHSETPKEKKKNTLPINVNAEEGEIYDKPSIPGSFSPNNDGYNETFEISIEHETVYSLLIVNMNNKGEVVFESKNKQEHWDGKHYKTGILCEPGNYLYILSYQYEGSDKLHKKSGIVALY